LGFIDKIFKVLLLVILMGELIGEEGCKINLVRKKLR